MGIAGRVLRGSRLAGFVGRYYHPLFFFSSRPLSFPSLPFPLSPPPVPHSNAVAEKKLDNVSLNTNPVALSSRLHFPSPSPFMKSLALLGLLASLAFAQNSVCFAFCRRLY